MERFFNQIIKHVLFLILSGLILPFALAEDGIRMGEDYYGNDIDAAIEEAQQSQRNVNYTNKYWYNRTTSKSFELPKMGSDDLEKERLEGALTPTASGKTQSPINATNSEQALTAQKNVELNEQENKGIAIDIKKPNIEIESIYFVPSTSHTFSRGDKVTTTGIINTGTVISTPRP